MTLEEIQDLQDKAEKLREWIKDSIIYLNGGKELLDYLDMKLEQKRI